MGEISGGVQRQNTDRRPEPRLGTRGRQERLPVKGGASSSFVDLGNKHLNLAVLLKTTTGLSCQVDIADEQGQTAGKCA